MDVPSEPRPVPSTATVEAFGDEHTALAALLWERPHGWTSRRTRLPAWNLNESPSAERRDVSPRTATAGAERGGARPPNRSGWRRVDPHRRHHPVGRADAFPAALAAAVVVVPIVLADDELPAPTLGYLRGGTPLVCGTTVGRPACDAAATALAR